MIAIDGPSSCGKSVTAISVAKALAYRYFSTGLLYRLLGYAWYKEGRGLDGGAKRNWR